MSRDKYSRLVFVPECSYGGETFCGLREVAEQRKLSGVIKVLEVPDKVRFEIKTQFLQTYFTDSCLSRWTCSLQASAMFA